MPFELHGGGVRFVASKDVHEVAERGDEAFPLKFHAFGGAGRRAEAEVTLYLEKAVAGESFRRDVSDGAKALLAAHAVKARSPATAPAAGYAPALDYYPIVKNVTEDDLAPEELTLKLGDCMRDAGGSNAQTFSAIPSLYTYLGQFIAHDITKMKVDGRHLDNWRTHALDLDSIFDPPDPKCVPPADTQDIGGVQVGRTTPSGAFRDLPRCTDPAGLPWIADTRNDNNLLVAQLTVAILRFHQKICQISGADEAACKDITRRHIQSVVLHDYLPRIVHSGVWNAFTDNGQRRSVLFPKGATKAFLVPVEFAAACFRFGHSQVRGSYRLNNRLSETEAVNVRRHTYLGMLSSALEDNWVVDVPGLMPQNAASIGPVLNSDLLRLPPEWIDDTDAPSDGIPYNLAKVTLWRGHTLRLPTGQRLQDDLKDFLPEGSPELAPIPRDCLLYAGSPLGALLSQPERDELGRRTPLWFYVLREAELCGTGGLGPLGSRIVLETIDAAIEAAPNNIVTGPPFRVQQGLVSARCDQFTLSDLVDSANLA